jgi:hypothetical protein
MVALKVTLRLVIMGYIAPCHDAHDEKMGAVQKRRSCERVVKEFDRTILPRPFA